MPFLPQQKIETICQHLRQLYGESRTALLTERLYALFGRYGINISTPTKESLWSEQDIILITYADTLYEETIPPLQTLNQFCREHLVDCISSVHILPFFPSSSDQGFAVINYRQVDSRFGNWRDIQHFSQDFKLMVDLVLNHCSSQSDWFTDYLSGIAPARNYFIEAAPNTDLSQVVRPRTSPLLRESRSRYGNTYVWSTFSHDQVDLNWANPDVLFEFLDLIFYYLHQGAHAFRLDAIGYLWKEIGTSCIHRPQTHTIVKLLRNILDLVAPDAWLITETNVPHQDNITYFGESDEAHAIYNFSLAPLILHGLLQQTPQFLYRWCQEAAPAPQGCSFINFTASHDGVGLLPLTGLLPDSEIDSLITQIKAAGGDVSMRSHEDSSPSPYELNISYVDALLSGLPQLIGIDRFICSQAIMLALRGIPAVYIHSLLGSHNDLEQVKHTGEKRAINRQRWHSPLLTQQLEDKSSLHAVIFERYKQLLRIRRLQPAFHPDAAQAAYIAHDKVLIIERYCPQQRILAMFNMTGKACSVPLAALPECRPLGPQTRNLLSSNKNNNTPKKINKLAPFQAQWLAENLTGN